MQESVHGKQRDAERNRCQPGRDYQDGIADGQPATAGPEREGFEGHAPGGHQQRINRQRVIRLAVKNDEYR